MNKGSTPSWRLVLLPFSWLYGLIIRMRNSLYDAGIMRSTGFNLPTIAVGNITLGGTGKTPHVEYLADLLRDDYRIAILSRGYMRKTRDFRIAGNDSSSQEIGDEPLQMKHRFPKLTVAVDRKRVHGIRELMKLAPPIELVLLDDAFQHRALRPGYAVLLIDYNRPLWEDHLLPAGNLREAMSGLHRANIILVTKSPENLKPIEMREYVNKMQLSLGQHLYFTRMSFAGMVPVFSEGKLENPESFRNSTTAILVLSGVVNPLTLVEFAKQICMRVEELHFRDHHRYTEKDIYRIVNKIESMKTAAENLLVLTTEKDAVKLRELALPEVIKPSLYAARIRVEFLNGDGENFKKQILSYVTSNKRGSVLYQDEDQ